MKTLTLYSEEALTLLRQALDVLEQSQLDDGFSQQQQHRRTSSSSSSSSMDDEESSSGSSSDDDSELEQQQQQKEEILLAGTEPPTVAASSAPHSSDDDDVIETTTKPTDRRKKKQSKRTNVSLAVKQRMGLPPMTDFALEKSDTILQVPAALVPKDDCSDPITMCQSCVSLAEEICGKKKLVVVLLLRSGRFAGGVFEGSQCLVHRACQRYTTRKGQGKAQSSLDSSGKGKAKSMGAQLRRAGELNLQEDVTTTLLDWQMYLNSAVIIFLSCPKTMKKSLFENGETYKFLPRNDDRIRRVPLDFGRPTFESVRAVYDTMMQVTVREKQQPDQITTDIMESSVVDTTTTTDAQASDEPRQEEAPKKEVEIIPLTPIHVAASEGNLSFLTELLASDTTKLDEQIDVQAGQDCMTPLHYAAMSSSSSSSSTTVDPSMAAAMVSALLVQCHANPCIVDSRNRPPYFLASHEKVRDAFRIARAALGEDYCLWDESAKVGPPLTSDNVKQRKEKAAEKKRRQRARQKEKKAKEKQHAAEMEKLQKEQELQRKQEEDAKRIRDGLQPKKASAGNNVCDFCQKVCKGKRRSQMFQRLEYAYCSSECVQKHKRELMASAALSRVGG